MGAKGALQRALDLGGLIGGSDFGGLRGLRHEQSSEVGEKWGGRKNELLFAMGSATLSVGEVGRGQASFTSLKSFDLILSQANSSTYLLLSFKPAMQERWYSDT